MRWAWTGNLLSLVSGLWKPFGMLNLSRPGHPGLRRRNILRFWAWTGQIRYLTFQRSFDEDYVSMTRNMNLPTWHLNISYQHNLLKLELISELNSVANSAEHSTLSQAQDLHNIHWTGNSGAQTRQSQKLGGGAICGLPLALDRDTWAQWAHNHYQGRWRKLTRPRVIFEQAQRLCCMRKAMLHQRTCCILLPPSMVRLSQWPRVDMSQPAKPSISSILPVSEREGSMPICNAWTESIFWKTTSILYIS